MRTYLLWLGALLLATSCSRRDEPKPVAEPSYEGTKLSAWLGRVQDVGSRELALTEPAKTAIRSLGTKALPWLARELIADELQVDHLRHYAGRGGPTAYDRNDAALRAFLVLGPDAAPAVSNIAPIFRVLDNYSNARYCVITALRAIGPPGVPLLLTGLKHPDSATRENSALALGGIQPPATDAVPDLLLLLSDADPVVRGAGAKALGQIHAEPLTVVPALIEVFRTAPDFVSNLPPKPCVVIRKGKPTASLVKPGWLSPGAKAENLIRIQAAAAEALGGYGPDAKDVLPDFRAYLQKPAPTDVYEEMTWRNVQSAIRKALPLIAGPKTRR